MAPKAVNTSLSDRDMELLRLYHRCLKSKPDVDYDKFTSLAGFGTVPSARACLVRLLNKVCGDEEASGGASPAKNTNGGEVAQETPAGKKKGASRKRKTDNAEGDDVEVSPTKGKGKKESAVKKKVDESGDEGAEEDI